MSSEHPNSVHRTLHSLEDEIISLDAIIVALNSVPCKDACAALLCESLSARATALKERFYALWRGFYPSPPPVAEQ